MRLQKFTHFLLIKSIHIYNIVQIYRYTLDYLVKHVSTTWRPITFLTLPIERYDTIFILNGGGFEINMFDWMIGGNWNRALKSSKSMSASDNLVHIGGVSAKEAVFVVSKMGQDSRIDLRMSHNLWLTHNYFNKLLILTRVRNPSFYNHNVILCCSTQGVDPNHLTEWKITGKLVIIKINIKSTVKQKSLANL